MNRVTRSLLAAALIAVIAAPAMAGDGETKKKKNRSGEAVLTAERAGWMMGLYVGEEKQKPYPFVIQVDRASDAYLKGIREGDELIKFDGLETQPLWRVFDQVNRTRPGREITLWVRRGAETLRYFVRVPKDPGAPPGERVEKPKKTDEPATGEDGMEKKKKKKKPPVVVKPIPPDEDPK
jgi:hypothetical protein